MSKQNKVAPSLLAFDLGRITEEVQRMEKAGADAIHIDIMDGHFVPNLTMGPNIVAAVNRSTDLLLDVHLMMYNPFDYIEPFVAAGADIITFHFEATENIEDTLQYIRKCNCQAGLSINPETCPTFIFPYLDQCDLILVMGVKPGFAGQKFQEEAIDKIRQIRKECIARKIFAHGEVIENPLKQKTSQPFTIQVDGGIDVTIGKKCKEAGADFLVSGDFFAKSKNLADSIQKFKNL